ncbi:MAG: aldehyde dehydrogenase family protein [Roseovarius sp.]|nr:aldehyde dehydrogenase family protein [Roseovarius sp.]
MKEYWRNHVDGKWIDGGAGVAEILNPATGALLARHACADESDIDLAVNAAMRVHRDGALSDMRPVERGRMVREMGRCLQSRKGEVARVLTLEQGKPLWEAEREVDGAARYFEYYGGQAETLEGRSIPLGAGHFDFTRLEPYGVSGQIIPWNFPLEIAARSLAAGLACGNACVVKTSELSPCSSWIFAAAAEAAGLPAGAVNILCGRGGRAGASLSRHAGVNQIVFTGSVETGISVAAAAAGNVVPCVLELGGKSAAIVYEDADLDAFESDIRWGMFYNAGQVCSAMSRVLVHASLHGELVERAREVASSMSVGPGIERVEAGLNMGSMIGEGQRDRAVEMVAGAAVQGARVAAGGRPLNMPGAFMEPTVVVDVTPEMDIARREVFGPVLSIMPFHDESRAIEISNGTGYGLVGGVFTRDLDRAARAAQKIRAGQVFVNQWFAGGVETPFGGYGKSGYGREKGREALMNYVQTKNVAIKISR